MDTSSERAKMQRMKAVDQFEIRFTWQLWKAHVAYLYLVRMFQRNSELVNFLFNVITNAVKAFTFQNHFSSGLAPRTTYFHSVIPTFRYFVRRKTDFAALCISNASLIGILFAAPTWDWSWSMQIRNAYAHMVSTQDSKRLPLRGSGREGRKEVGREGESERVRAQLH